VINPNDVNLIIFDMDGTVVASLPAVYESIKRAFKKLGWQVTFSASEINRFFGVSTASTGGSLYEFITPPGSPLSPEEVREKVRAEYGDVFREMTISYPAVKETLAALRKRGYKLAQYTNASTAYLDIVMSNLEIRDYYDYVECIQDNNLNKSLLVKKIKERFGGMTAAVIGDRSHDIEAARENGCLSIGALYGYGEKEPEEADIKINRFADLLTIFDRRLPIFERILKAIGERKERGRAYVIGINGIDCSGKTTFAKALEAWLRSIGYLTQLIAIDDFHNPRETRYAGSNQADNYYNESFNIKPMIEKLLKPLRETGRVAAELRLLNLNTDKYDTVKKYSIDPDTIVIMEGVFLFRKELAPFIDYKIYLDITFEESKRRAKERDSRADMDKYDTKYLPAQERYIGI